MSITNKLTYLEQTKEGIKQAIINKGVNVSDTDTFRSYIDKIDSITTGGGSGDCDVSTCWDSLGYTTTPQYLDDAIAYGAQIKDTWDTSSTRFIFSNNSDIIYFPSLDVSNVSSATFFSYDANLQYVGRLNFSSKIHSLNNLFSTCKKLIEVDGINTWDTSGVTSMSFAFQDCESLKSLDLSNWDVSNVTNMWKTFANCKSLTLLNLTGWSPKPTQIESLFTHCEKVPSLNVTGWDVSGATDCTSVFSYCKKLTEITGLNTWVLSSTTKCNYMFRDCQVLTTIDLSGGGGDNLTNMNSMFYYCNALTDINLSNFDTSKVTDMGSIFYACYALEKVDGFLDLTSCNYSNTYSYFVGNSNLTKLRKITFKNIGYQSAKTAINFSYINWWGVDTDTITDARQSLIDSLITYSFDRASAGYATHTITLGTQTKAVLTKEEIAQITAKGYTIA